MLKNYPVTCKVEHFLVPAGVYKSIPAVQRSWQNNLPIEPGIFHALIFSPLTKADFDPDIIFLVCNSEQAMMYCMPMPMIQDLMVLEQIQDPYAVQWHLYHTYG
jgi:hypothetical protein